MQLKNLQNLFLSAVLGLGSLALQAESLKSTATNKTEASFSDFYNQLKESPLSFSFLNDISTTNTGMGYDNLAIGYLGYKLTDKDKLRLETRMKTKRLAGSKADGKDRVSNTFARTVLKYTRSGLLTQEENGVNLSFNLEERYLPDSDDRAKGADGHHRASLTFSNDFNNGFSLSNTLYYALMNRNSNTAGDKTRDYFYGLFIQSYSITEKLALSTFQEVLHFNTVNPIQEQDSFEAYFWLDLAYQFTPEVAASLYTFTVPWQSTDKAYLSANSQAFNEYTIGATLSIAAF